MYRCGGALPGFLFYAPKKPAPYRGWLFKAACLLFGFRESLQDIAMEAHQNLRDFRTGSGTGRVETVAGLTGNDTRADCPADRVLCPAGGACAVRKRRQGGSAGYSQHTIYETNTLHTTSGISVASITSAPHCGFQWYDNALYFIPNNSNSQTNLLALDLDNKKRIQLEPFSRTGSEDVGLKFKDSKIIPYRSSNHSAGSCPELASLSLLPSNWKMISDSYGISNDGKTLFWGSRVPNAGQALWIAAYNNNRMTFVGRVIGTGIAPQLVSGADLMMQPFTSSGTPGTSDTVKSFLLNSSTFAPVA